MLIFLVHMIFLICFLFLLWHKKHNLQRSSTELEPYNLITIIDQIGDRYITLQRVGELTKTTSKTT
jgi:hypothetical protein